MVREKIKGIAMKNLYAQDAPENPSPISHSRGVSPIRGEKIPEKGKTN